MLEIGEHYSAPVPPLHFGYACKRLIHARTLSLIALCEMGKQCMPASAPQQALGQRCCWQTTSDFTMPCAGFFLTFLSNLSTSVAWSILRSRSSFWISLIHATLLMYGLWLVLRSIPGSLSDLSISANRKSPPPRPPLSLSPALFRSLRRLLEKFSLSKLLCLLSLEPMVLLFVGLFLSLFLTQSDSTTTKRTIP